MKRITVSLPDDLAAEVRHAAGGEGRVSAYVAAALEEHREQERLDDLLSAWKTESPVPEDVQRQVESELDGAGLGDPAVRSRVAG